MIEACLICQRPRKNKFAKYCKYGCSRLMSRANGGKKEEREERRNAVRSAWKNGAFRCRYSGIELDISDSSSPFYFSFDHATPRSGSEIFACAQFLNDMKTDTTVDEFKHNILTLAVHFKTGQELSRSDFRVQHFSRNHTKKNWVLELGHLVAFDTPIAPFSKWAPLTGAHFCFSSVGMLYSSCT